MRPHWRYRYERLAMGFLAWLVLRRRLQVGGIENVPATGACIIVCNHVATVDPPLMSYRIPRLDVFSMAKSDSFRRGLARFFLRGWNAFPVVRHTADRTALGVALQVLREGHVLVIFPEGSRSADSSMGRAYSGVGFIARHSGAPVVPASIVGSEHVLPKGAWIPRSAAVEVRFGQPFVVPARLPDGTRVRNQAAADLVMARVAELLPERYRGVYGTAVAGGSEEAGEEEVDGDGRPPAPRRATPAA